MGVARAIGTGALLLSLLLPPMVAASSLDQMPSVELNRGIKALLDQGARGALDSLGRPAGFSGSPKVRIPLPDGVRQARSALLQLGRGKQIEELERGLNLAAEEAMPQLRYSVLDAVRELVIYDPKSIVRGGGDAATRYFRQRSQAQLQSRLAPIVKQITDRQGLARTYNALADKARPLGLTNNEHARVDEYVTARALEGLFVLMAEQERRQRIYPATAGNEALRKVFGGAY